MLYSFPATSWESLGAAQGALLQAFWNELESGGSISLCICFFLFLDFPNMRLLPIVLGSPKLPEAGISQKFLLFIFYYWLFLFCFFFIAW